MPRSVESPPGDGVFMDTLIRVHADFAGAGEAKRTLGHEPLIEEIVRQPIAQLQLAHLSEPGLATFKANSAPASTTKITSWYKNSEKSLRESAS